MANGLKPFIIYLQQRGGVTQDCFRHSWIVVCAWRAGVARPFCCSLSGISDLRSRSYSLVVFWLRSHTVEPSRFHHAETFDSTMGTSFNGSLARPTDIYLLFHALSEVRYGD